MYNPAKLYHQPVSIPGSQLPWTIYLIQGVLKAVSRVTIRSNVILERGWYYSYQRTFPIHEYVVWLEIGWIRRFLVIAVPWATIQNKVALDPRMIDRLIDWSIDWLIDWSIDWLIDWFIDLLSERVIDWLIDWLIESIDWLIYWLLAWLNDWFIDWLID